LELGTITVVELLFLSQLVIVGMMLNIVVLPVEGDINIIDWGINLT
jgi:hypothetical protein